MDIEKDKAPGGSCAPRGLSVSQCNPLLGLKNHNRCEFKVNVKVTLILINLLW